MGWPAVMGGTGPLTELEDDDLEPDFPRLLPSWGTVPVSVVLTVSKRDSVEAESRALSGT